MKRIEFVADVAMTARHPHEYIVSTNGVALGRLSMIRKFGFRHNNLHYLMVALSSALAKENGNA